MLHKVIDTVHRGLIIIGTWLLRNALSIYLISSPEFNVGVCEGQYTLRYENTPMPMGARI